MTRSKTMGTGSMVGCELHVERDCWCVGSLHALTVDQIGPVLDRSIRTPCLRRQKVAHLHCILFLEGLNVAARVSSLGP